MVNKLQDCWVNKGMKPVCTDCGSDNLVFDAHIQWNITKEDWELISEPDIWYCRTCSDDEPRIDYPAFICIREHVDEVK